MKEHLAGAHEAISDEYILSSIKTAGHKEVGFKMLVDKYKERVYWNIRRMVDSHHDADDIVQEVFIKVYKNLSLYKEDARLYTWIYRISVNESLTFLKKRKRSRVVSIEDHSLIMNKKASSEYDGEQVISALKRAIQVLPVRQKLIFNMRYFEEMKYEEMSQILGTTIGALKASYHHAVKKIELYIRSYES